MFDVADGGFTFYNEKQWAEALVEWRRELREEGQDVDYFNEYDLVDMKFGDEVFIEEMPSEYRIVLDK
jgi:hypothetical protein